MSDSVRVLVVDDDPLVRDALGMVLRGADDLELTGTAADGDEVPGALDAHGVDVVLMDLRMARVDGLTATERIQGRPRPPAVLVLTTFDADDDVLAALRAGAAGFLVKDTPPAELVEAIHRVASGEPVLSPGVMRRLMDRGAAQSRARQRALGMIDALTDREREVVAAIGEGLSNAEIAEDRHMSVATVKSHVTHVFTKLDLTSRTQLAVLAHEAGLA